MVGLVPPHGGRLLSLLVVGEERKEGFVEAETLPKVRLRSKDVSDLTMLAMGAFSPLDGFLKKQDYESVVAEMRLKNGLLWPIPITLSVSKHELAIKGYVPLSPADVFSSCRFYPRCPYAVKRCREGETPLVDVGHDHCVACIKVKQGN